MTIILSLLNGSRLYGLEHEYSDTDIINVYMKRRTDYYINEPDKIKFRKIDGINYQVTYIDLLTLCRQLLKCNPNFLIPLLSRNKSILYIDNNGDRLLNNIYLFLDYERCSKAFTGMAESAFDRDKPMNIEKSNYLRGFRDGILQDLPINAKADLTSIKFMLDDMFNYLETEND